MSDAPKAAPRCANCKSPRAKIFRRKVCRSCYRKLGLGSASVSADGRRTRSVPAKSGKTRRGGPDARVEAMRLLAEGWQVKSVAASLKVNRDTVLEWRDSPDGQRELAEARKAREAAFADAVADAWRLLKEGTAKAAQRLLDDLDSGDAEVRQRAARTILDRAGLVKPQQYEVTGARGGPVQVQTGLLVYMPAEREP